MTGLSIIAARDHGLIPFFVMYQHEALIPATPMTVDIILPHSWDSICKDERVYTEELVVKFVGQRSKVDERLRQAGEK